MVRFHPGSFRQFGSVGVSAARRHGRAEDRVQFPDGPLRSANEMGCWSNGTTTGLQPGNRGSTPRRSTDNDGLMVQREDIRLAV